ncbi:hypothetical protein L596_002121 [Steinernema carpocapsae]|uniref:GPI alpha-1,4-mannosyltransferase I, catalytic subunit n=1 Tax=Steinernema carpocapsae TaxID=34508 RepID=A0A4U8UQA9_STECR|nr:hypothetical protein L596_002121 [Steinernema carpocapsae]
MKSVSRGEDPFCKVQRWSPWSLMKVAIAARLVLVFYGRIHDYFFSVGFTDVDYHVVSDAGKLLLEGRSPFERATYRYTPILAWMVTPNVLFYDFGKILFSFFDILVGWLGYEIAISNMNSRSPDNAYLSRCNVAVSVWLFLPVTAIVSTRGNSDVVVCAAVLLSLYLLEKKKLLWSALVYGCLAVQSSTFHPSSCL